MDACDGDRGAWQGQHQQNGDRGQNQIGGEGR